MSANSNKADTDATTKQGTFSGFSLKWFLTQKPATAPPQSPRKCLQPGNLEIARLAKPGSGTTPPNSVRIGPGSPICPPSPGTAPLHVQLPLKQLKWEPENKTSVTAEVAQEECRDLSKKLFDETEARERLRASLEEQLELNLTLGVLLEKEQQKGKELQAQVGQLTLDKSTLESQLVEQAGLCKELDEKLQDTTLQRDGYTAEAVNLRVLYKELQRQHKKESAESAANIVNLEKESNVLLSHLKKLEGELADIRVKADKAEDQFDAQLLRLRKDNQFLKEHLSNELAVNRHMEALCRERRIFGREVNLDELLTELTRGELHRLRNLLYTANAEINRLKSKEKARRSQKEDHRDPEHVPQASRSPLKDKTGSYNHTPTKTGARKGLPETKENLYYGAVEQ